jgi:ABC-type uncharacterized transport system substrate-binding protein
MAATEATTVLFLTREESGLFRRWDAATPPSPARSARLSMTTQTEASLSGFIMTTTPPVPPIARRNLTLAERCQPHRTDVMVAFDREAAQAAMQECAAPLLMVQVSRQQATPLLDFPPDRRASAIYLEAHPLLNLQLARVLLPHARTVGVWVPTPAPPWVASLRAEARRLQLTLEEMVVSDDLEAVRALRPRLAHLDAVLLPPDSTLINEWSLKPLLLMTIRQGVPVLGGLTAAYVEAGVLAAVVADEARLPEQMQFFITELAHERVPLPAYPTAVRVVVNTTVAQTLGLSTDVIARAQALFSR